MSAATTNTKPRCGRSRRKRRRWIVRRSSRRWGRILTLLVEPLNSVKDHKGYYLTDSNEGFDLIREVDSPRVRLLYDIYHQHHMGEDVLRRIEDNLDFIGHYHIAGHPNRDEKIFENFDYRAVFDLLKKHNVTAPVGVELFPSSEDALRQLLQNLRAVVYEND